MTNGGKSSAPSADTSLRLDWCNYEAAKYAVEHWHYSHAMPTPPMICIGAWEADLFTGAIVFSRGANNNLGKAFGLDTTEVCELTLVALRSHTHSVSRMLAVALRFLKRRCPGLRLCVSYADPNQGHVGAIYQAGNWIYSGATSPDAAYIDRTGRRWHNRQVSQTGVKRQFGSLRRVPRHDDCLKVPLLGKHRYLMPLDEEMRRRIQPLAQPYPKRERSSDSGAPVHQTGGGGASPTGSLASVPE